MIRRSSTFLYSVQILYIVQLNKFQMANSPTKFEASSTRAIYDVVLCRTLYRTLALGRRHDNSVLVGLVIVFLAFDL